MPKAKGPKKKDKDPHKLPQHIKMALQGIAAFHAMSEIYDSGEKIEEKLIDIRLWNRLVGPNTNGTR